MFALPGVKVLVPSGLKNNGALNNTSWTTTDIITSTQTTELENVNIVINTTNNSLNIGDYTYDPKTNYNYNNGSISNGSVIIGSATFSSGVMTSATLKNVLSLKLN